jgi:hypothetical protein
MQANGVGMHWPWSSQANVTGGIIGGGAAMHGAPQG